MSRVGKKPISISDKTKISYKDKVFTVQGEKGTLTRSIHPAVDLLIEDGVIKIVTVADNRISRSFQGMTRSLVANMVTGAEKGFERVLELNGIGYRATLKENCIVFNIGFSQPVNFDLPEGISAVIDKNNVIRLAGIDNEQLGQTAAAIRRLKPPEPYKGKGIKYAEERIQKKAGKVGTSGAS
jgi:large subunit ribosomal protein L6